MCKLLRLSITVLAGGLIGLNLAGCAPPAPPQRVLPTLPAVLDITPAPTLDIDATATIYAGQTRPTATTAALYTVQAGDTLSDLAQRFNTSVDELVAANSLLDPNVLQPGDTLIIPSLLRTPVVETNQPAATPTPTIATP